MGGTWRLTFGSIALLAGLAASPLATAQNSPTIEGIWVTPSQSEMTIAPCVEGYCGYISKIVITDQIRAKYGDAVDSVDVYTDYNNKDPGLRDRPIQGLKILTLSAKGARSFEGEIYSPEDGNTYDGFIELLAADRLKLKGCAMMVFCAEQEWQRIGPAN